LRMSVAPAASHTRVNSQQGATMLSEHDKRSHAPAIGGPNPSRDLKLEATALIAFAYTWSHVLFCVGSPGKKGGKSFLRAWLSASASISGEMHKVA